MKRDTKMKLTTKSQNVINSLKSGRQPAKNTPKWILEGLEQALLIQWGSIDGRFNGWKIA